MAEACRKDWQACVQIHAVMSHLYQGMYCIGMAQVMHARPMVIALVWYAALAKKFTQMLVDAVGSDWCSVRLDKQKPVIISNPSDRHIVTMLHI